MPLSIPQDIIYCILSNFQMSPIPKSFPLAYDNPSRLVSSPDLTNFALVQKSWVRPARKALLHCVYIDLSHPRRAVTLLRLLQSEDYGCFVNQIVCNFMPDSSSAVAVEAYASLGPIIRACTQLRHVFVGDIPELVSDAHSRLTEALLSGVHSETLDLHWGCALEPGSFPSEVVLPRIKALQKLALRGANISSIKSSGTHPSFASLHMLHLHDTHVSPEFIRCLPDLVLRELHLSSMRVDATELRAALLELPTLRTFTFYFLEDSIGNRIERARFASLLERGVIVRDRYPFWPGPRNS